MVLIVEDDRTYAYTTANWLKKHSIDARYVLSVDKAKLFLYHNEVDLILSDFRLKESNGIELLEWIKAEGYQIPFLIMTGYADIPGAVLSKRELKIICQSRFKQKKHLVLSKKY